MSDQGMRNLENLYYTKVRQRVNEVRQRFIWTDAVNVTDLSVAETMEHIPLAEAKRLRYKPVAGGFQWGKPWSTAWFRLRFAIPAAFRGETVSLTFRTEGEALIFRDGLPVQALDHGRDSYIVFDRARGGERVELYVEAGASGAFGDFRVRTIQQPRIAVLNREVWEAYWDLAALADMVEPTEQKTWRGKVQQALPLHDTRRARILFALTRAVDLFDYDRPTRAELREQACRVRRALKPIFACRATDSAQTIACMGHAHIDVAWLWRLAETVRKCGRTFSNVLELMDRYPEFKFVQSQPHLYEFTRDRYPSLYRRIREKARQGQWVPTGGMWVEADCNLTSGESLVRQLLFGTRFFRKEFHYESKCLWIPDVFGYSAALPQIIRRSGLEYFLTQKISWSQFTQFPYHTFWWEGIDGTRVLTHFPPADDYNSQLSAIQMIMAARDYREKDRSPIQAVPFGFGDGGGGPTADMLERRRRYHDLEGMPKLRPMSPEEFFQRLEAESRDLRTWVGELYLEFHRGTYTTQADNKKFNRQSELLLRETEMLSALNIPLGAKYEQERLNRTWKTVLLNQFHDVLPGSSIDEVYADSARQYRELLADTSRVRNAAFEALARRTDTRGAGIPVLAFNALSWERTGIVAVPAAKLESGEHYIAAAADGSTTPVQVGADGQARFAAALPSIGHAVFHIAPGRTEAPVIAAGLRGMENDLIRVSFDPKGRLSRVYDKAARREVLAAGAAGNQFILFEDKMVACGPAWDIDIFYNDKPLEFDGRLLSVRVVERGPVRSVVRIRRAISRSVITQDVILTAGSKRIDFATRIEWGDEKDVLLKVAFPVNVRSDDARYEIQFGNVKRPTHWNRPQDFGMFEVPAQRWADLSEADYGVALLNDCKYGHDIRGNVMRLSLLRAPKSPGQTADVGKTHTFTYALLPHEGSYVNGVVRAGYELNVPPTAAVVPASAGVLPARLSRLEISGDNVVIETVKKAEDDRGIVVRLYEAHGCRGRRTLRIGLPAKRAIETNLVEKEERPLPLRDGRMALDFTPFQIRTVKLVF